MSSLTGSQINQSYQGLIKLADSTTGITSGVQTITDGEGNSTGIRIGQDFFQPVWGVSQYPVAPNDYYGVGIGGTQITPTASQVNNKTVNFFYDRGVESYSAVTWNVWIQFDVNEWIDYAFYKIDYIAGQGYVPTDRVSDVYSYSGVQAGAGFRVHTLPSNLSFSGTGPGVYAMVLVYNAPDGTLTGRLTSLALSSTSALYPLMNANMGFVKNTINNAAPTWWSTNSTAQSGQFTMSGTSLSSSFTSSNYPGTSFISSGIGAGFLLNTVK